MVRVVGIDHLAVSVSDFAKSKSFYAPLMEFLGFDVEAEYEGMMGWANGKTLFWIAAADAQGKKHKYRKGDVGFHHYAFRLRSRKDVDALQTFLESQGATIVDPAGEYYNDYYAVFFLDPDGMKLEGMRYGERHDQTAKKRAGTKRGKAKRKVGQSAAAACPARRSSAMMSAVDQPISMMPFSAIIGLSSRHCSGATKSASPRVV